MDSGTKGFLFNYFLFQLPLILFGTAMIWIGLANIPKNEDEVNGCPSAAGLPYLLFIGGVVLVVGITLRYFLNKMCVGCNASCCKDCKVGGKLMKCGAIVLYDTALVMVSAVWCIAGSIYTARNIKETPFNKIGEFFGDAFDSFSEQIEEAETISKTLNQDGVFVCTDTVYNMTVISLIAGFAVTALAAVFLVLGRLCCNIVCCKPCRSEDEITNA